MSRFVIRDSKGAPYATEATCFDAACEKLGLNAEECTGEVLRENVVSPLTAWADCTPPRKKKLTHEQVIRLQALREVEGLFDTCADCETVCFLIAKDKWQKLKDEVVIEKA